MRKKRGKGRRAKCLPHVSVPGVSPKLILLGSGDASGEEGKGNRRKERKQVYVDEKE